MFDKENFKFFYCCWAGSWRLNWFILVVFFVELFGICLKKHRNMFENWTRGAKITSKLVCLGQTFHWKFKASPKTGGVVGPPATKGRLVFLMFFGILMCVCRVKWGRGWGRVGQGGAGWGGVGWGMPCYWIFSCTRRFRCICMLCYRRFSCTCIQTSCYATDKSLALAHGLHATLPKVLSRLHTDLMLCYRNFSCTWIQTSCDARVVFPTKQNMDRSSTA